MILEARSSSIGSGFGEARAKGFIELGDGVDLIEVGLGGGDASQSQLISAMGGIKLKVRGAEIGDSGYGMGLKKYKLKGSWESSTEVSEWVLLLGGRMDMRLDLMANDEEYNKFVSGESGAIGIGTKVSEGPDDSRFRLWLDGVEIPVVLLGEADDEIYESGELDAGKVYVKSSRDQLRHKGVVSSSEWKVLSMGSNQEVYGVGFLRIRSGVSGVYISHVPRDVGEYLTCVIEDSEHKLVSVDVRVEVYKTDVELEVGVVSVGQVGVSMESGLLKAVLGEGHVVGFRNGGWKAYGVSNWESDWVDYKEYGSDRERWFMEKEIRRRGHAIDYRRKSNGEGYGWNTSRKKNWDAFLYREMPLTVDFAFMSGLNILRSESLTSFVGLGIRGREPSQVEKDLYGMELSMDGLRWEASLLGGLVSNGLVFSYGLDSMRGGVNAVGRKKMLRGGVSAVEQLSELSAGSVDSYNSEVTGFSAGNPYVFNVEKDKLENGVLGGDYYNGSKKLSYGVGMDYIIEEGVDVFGGAELKSQMKESDRNTNRLVLLNRPRGFTGDVRNFGGVSSILIGDGLSNVRGVGGFKVDGVELVAGVDYELVGEGVVKNKIQLKEERGMRELEALRRSGGDEDLGYGDGAWLLSKENGAGWVSLSGAVSQVSVGGGFSYEKKVLSGGLGDRSVKNIVVGEVMRDLMGAVRDEVLECRVFKEVDLVDAGSIEGVKLSGGFWLGEGDEWFPIDVIEEVDFYGIGEIQTSKQGGWVLPTAGDYKWRVDIDGDWIEWDEELLLSENLTKVVYKSKKALAGEYNLVTDELNLGLPWGVLSLSSIYGLGWKMRKEKVIVSYEGSNEFGGAIALSTEDSAGGGVSKGDKLYVLYNLLEIVTNPTTGLNEETVTEGVEEVVSFVNTEDVECVTEGTIEVTNALASSVVSIVDLGNGETYTGVGVVGEMIVGFVGALVGRTYRATYVMDSSPKGGEQVLRVVGKINEVYLEVVEGDNKLSVGGRGEGQSVFSSRIYSSLMGAGVVVGSILEIGTHLFSVASISSEGVVFEQEARYDVRVYVSGLSKGSSPNVFSILDSASGIESVGFQLSGWEVLGYNKEGTELEISKGLGLIEDGHIIRLGVGGEFYRVSGTPREGRTSYIVKVAGKLSKDVTGKVGLEVACSVRRGDVREGATSFVGKPVYVNDGFELLVRAASDRYDVLKNGEDYLLDSASGLVNLLKGRTIKAGDIYMLMYSIPVGLKAVVKEDGSVHYPKYEIVDAVLEKKPTQKEVDRGLFYRGKTSGSNQSFYITSLTEEEIETKIVAEKSIDLYPTTGNWVRAGEGVQDLLVKDAVARNSLFKYHELLLNLESQIGSFKGDGGIIEEMSYWIENGAYWGGWDSVTGSYGEEYFYNGRQAGLSTNELEDNIREGYKWRPYYASNVSRFYPRSLEYVVKLETEVEFKGKKAITRKNNGVIESLGYGEIDLVTDIELRDRKGRFKIAGIVPNLGYVYLSAVSLDLFPDVEAFGFLPNEKFVSQAIDPEELQLYTTTGEMKVEGRLPDVVSGRYDYFYKGLKVGVEVTLATRAGVFLVYDYSSPIVVGPSYDYVSGDTNKTTLGYARSVVESIEDGYKVKLSGIPVVIIDGQPQSLWAVASIGDTIIDVGGGGSSGLTGKWEDQDLNALSFYGDTYDIGKDIKFNRKTGEFSEKKLSSFFDPGFPWLEILGQHKPKDGEFYGGEVEFNNKDTEPYIFPGLDGEFQRSYTGDEGIPLLYRNGEAISLREAAGRIRAIIETEVLGQRVYPDELRAEEGHNGDEVTKPFELLYTTSSNVPYYLGYVDALNAGYYTVFECASTQVVYRIQDLQYITPLNMAVSKVDDPVYPNYIYSFVSLAGFTGLDANFLTKEGLKLVFRKENDRRMVLHCGATPKVDNGGGLIDVLNIEYVAAAGRLTLETAKVDGDWFDYTGFAVVVVGNVTTGVNVAFDCAFDFESYQGQIASNLKVFSDATLSNTVTIVYSGAKLHIGGDVEVEGLQGVMVEITDGNFLLTSFCGGDYPITSITNAGVVVLDVVTPASGDIPQWSILVGSQVDSSGLIFTPDDVGSGGCVYIRRYGLITDAVGKNNDYSRVRAGDLVIMPTGYEVGAHRVLAVNTEEFTGRKPLRVAYPQVIDIVVGSLTIATNALEMYPTAPGVLYINVNASTQYKATWTAFDGTTFTIGAVQTLAGAPIDVELSTLVGSFLSGMTVLPVLEPLLSSRHKDLDGKLYQDGNEYVVTFADDGTYYESAVALQISPFSGSVEANVTIFKGILIDETFEVQNKYTGDIKTSIKSSFTSYLGGLYDDTLSLTISGVEVRRPRRFSDFYTKLTSNFKDLYTYYAKHIGMTAGGVGFIANYYMLLSQVTLSDEEAEYLGYMTEKSPNLFSVTLDVNRPKVSVGDELRLAGGIRTKVVKVVTSKTVWFIIKDKIGMPEFTKYLPVTKITNGERGDYLPVPAVPAPYDAAMAYELQYRNIIGEYPLEQTFESLVGNAFTTVYSVEDGGAGVDVGGEIMQGGFTVGDLLLTEVLQTDGRPAYTEAEAVADLVENCYLVIDGKGFIVATGETSLPPEGDFWNGVAVIQQEPSGLDDNRGVYKIDEVIEGQYFKVTPVIAIDGFLPAVNGVEGVDANKLLLSLPPDEITNLYGDNPRGSSIDNYGFKVLRKKGHVSFEMGEMILFMRERTFSWMEKLEDFADLMSFEGSSWDYFEASGYLNIGSSDPASLSDVRLLGYEGNVDELSYQPTIDRLSLFERRMWIEDGGLSDEGYNGYPNPGALTTIEEQIKADDVRGVRNDWIEKRISLTDGTLTRFLRYNW